MRHDWAFEGFLLFTFSLFSLREIVLESMKTRCELRFETDNEKFTL